MHILVYKEIYKLLSTYKVDILLNSLKVPLGMFLILLNLKSLKNTTS